MDTTQFCHISNRLGLRTHALVVAAALVSLSGCQSWRGAMPFQSPTRVPAPGTGTVHTGGDYYNGTSSLAPAGGVMPASATAGVSQSANNRSLNRGGSPPDPTFVTPAFATAPSSGQSVDSAAAMLVGDAASSGGPSSDYSGTLGDVFSGEASDVPQFTDDPSMSTPVPASASLNDAEPPSLDWRP